MRITLRQLEVFRAIAHSENVSRAAEQLAMSQSAASNALSELERHFTQPLFDRIGKSLKLNSTGSGLLPMAEDTLARAHSIESYLSGSQIGPLAVGATLTIGNYLAALIAADYLRQHPQARIKLHVANTREIVNQVLRCELDIGLIEGEAHDPDLHLTRWMQDRLVVFCAPEHPLSTLHTVDNATLAQQSWIVRESGSGTRALFDRSIPAQLSSCHIQLELEHTEAIKRAVESGLGIGCLSRLSLREAFQRGSLVELRTPQFKLERNFYFASHQQRQQSPAASVFLELCEKMSGGAKHTDDLPCPLIR
jgi:DNA-binding transcriptional LysR family regulator